MLKKYNSLILLVLSLFISAEAFSGASAAGEAAAVSMVAVALNNQNQAVMASLAAANTSEAGSGIGDNILSGCIAGQETACNQLYSLVKQNLEKLLTPKFRMTHSIHLFRPNKLQYSFATAQKIALALSSARK